MSSYYRPYTSGSDSGSGSDSEYETGSDTGSETESETHDISASLPNFRALAEGLMMTGIGGPSFDLSGEIVYAKHPIGYPLDQANPSFKDYEVKVDTSGTQLKSNTQSVNSIIMLNSTDRDRVAYPQPTLVTLRLPRVYKNVTSFQIVQIKLLSSFFYFRKAKQNTEISIVENGRTVDGQLAIVNTTIREGTYDINSLLTELTTELNQTPLFYDFPNGFQEFAIRFASTGDFGVNFNYPGDYFYERLSEKFIANPTMTTIVSHFFQNQYAGLSSYTTDQIKVAYYYPVLKEALLDTPILINLGVTVQPQAGETVYSRCIYTFQGIDDPLILAVINLNLGVLDAYRLQHTFRYSLVNQYAASVESQSNRIALSSSGLNRSLVNLLQVKQTQYLAEALTQASQTAATYAALQTQNSLLLAVLNDMFYYLQRYLATYFGISFNTYDISYLANPEFVVPIRDATGAIGISSNYDAEVLARGTKPITTNILTQFQQNPPYYWPGYTGNRITSFPINLETGNSLTSSNYAYDVMRGEQNRSRRFIDLSTNIMYTNPLTRVSDIVVPVNGAEYTIFKFKSPVRQTLQIETLPRPTEYRYPAYNAAYAENSNKEIFDNSYSFVNSYPLSLDWILDNADNYALQEIPGYSTAPFGLSYENSLALWDTTYITSYIGRTVNIFQFVTPTPMTFDMPPYRYPISVTLTTTSGNFVTPMSMFIYHDRAAFLADLSSNGSESPYNYMSTASTTTSISSTTLTLNVYAGQRYYVLVRAPPTSATQRYRLIPWNPSGEAYTALSSSLDGFNPLADPTTPAALSNFNYAQVTDPAWLRLPISSNLIPPTTVDPLFTPLTFSRPAIGYDANGVSTDATSYFGFTQGTFGVNDSVSTRIDPITGYIFQKSAPYNPSTQSYFYSGSVNAILTPQGASVYTPTAVAKRETSIVHTYYNAYLPNSENQAPILSGQVVNNSKMQPFTPALTTAPIGGYTYGGSNASIQFGDGVMGISFVPQQGVWNIERVVLASAYVTTDPTIDTNRGIKYLGVFNAGELPTYAGSVSLTSSIAVLAQSTVKTYDGSNLNFGFGTGGGTFYEYKRDYTFGSNTVYGYSQISGQINTDQKAMYTLIPFDSAGSILPYQCLMGSLVPYPLINSTPVDVSSVYLDGTAPPDGKSLIVPKTTLQPNYDITQSTYEQSMPIGTTVLHYMTPFPFLQNPNAMQTWPTPPSFQNPIFDVNGYVLTQDSTYHVYSYPKVGRTFTEAYQFTQDQVVPSQGAQYIGVAANESVYAFAFYIPETVSLRFELMDPSVGRISSSLSYPSPVAFDQVQLQNFTYNNAGGFTLTILQGGINSIVYSLPTGTSTSYTTLVINGSRVITRQPPKNSTGQFYTYILDVVGATSKYLYVDPTVVGNTFTAPSAQINGLPVSTKQYDLSGGPYTNPIVARQPYRDELFFLKPGSTAIYQITGYENTTAFLTPTAFEFPVPPSIMYQGALGARWVYGDALYANQNDFKDAPKRITPAWQIFYPTQKITFTHVANNFNFLNNIEKLKYPEYPHTAITIYNSIQKLQADLGPIDGVGKWGQESSSNFLVADYRFSGQIFNGSVFSVPLEAGEYYATIRNYTPTEKSQVLLRCSLPNKYDFGYVKLSDLSSEVQIAALSSNLFAPDYYASLTGFNSNFVLSSMTFGENIIQGYNGSNFSNITGFGDFYNRFTSLYATYNSQVQLVQSINNSVTSNINNFIKTDLRYILPTTAQTRQRYTDPLTFSILWKSSLDTEYGKKEDNWGLGWNLGFDKVNTDYATVHISQSFFKILDDYINLRLNPEYDMNRMDSGAKENLSMSQDTTGSTKAFHGKLLLANFGSYAQTLISNPVAFAPPLGRMDKLTFQWLDTTETQIDNSNCEWNVVIQVVEKMEVVDIPKMPHVYPGASMQTR